MRGVDVDALLRRVALLERAVRDISVQLDLLDEEDIIIGGGGGTTIHANEMHDPDMALASHDHDADYSDIAHDHDADYADVAHAHTFLALSDTPSSYSGQALKAARVNAGETGLEFATVTTTVTKEAVFVFQGTVAVASWPLRFYNQSGATRTITKVALGVEVAPTGQEIIVDVHKNGTTIFTTQANRPQIAASANTGNTTTIDVTSWGAGDYLTIDIDQAGSGVAGEDLIVHLFYTE